MLIRCRRCKKYRTQSGQWITVRYPLGGAEVQETYCDECMPHVEDEVMEKGEKT